MGPYKINDSHSGLGLLTIREAFAKSSNVAFAKLIHSNYKDDIESYWKNLHEMHLDQLTGLGLSGEVKPKINRDSVSKGRYSLAYMGMGYQVLITPLHTCMVYNAIANNGKMMKPYLVNAIREYGKDVVTYEPTVLHESILDSATIAPLKETMNAVVEIGTGKALKNNYYSICGKTGTAQVADKGIKYSDRVYHGSFVGFFPKEDPQYTICVVLRTRKGSSNYYGGQIALPVFKEVANRLYAINMHNANTIARREQTKNRISTKSMNAEAFQIVSKFLNLEAPVNQANGFVHASRADSNGKLQVKPLIWSRSIVPDVNGMGLRDAMYTLEKMGLHVEVKGKGKVTAQSIDPGSAIQKGQKIQLQLG
jgi:cell division protein FtsI (penicillin-binding protein 3)